MHTKISGKKVRTQWGLPNSMQQKVCIVLSLVTKWKLLSCSRTRYIGNIMDQVYIKTPNPKCRFFLKIDK